MQIVLITNRPERALESLTHVEALMPFVTKALCICPSAQVDAFAWKGRLDVTALDEAQALGDQHAAFLRTHDHQARNLFLRCAVASCDAVDDEFLMADDDNRPLREISLELFKRDGKYRGFYYSQLQGWQARETDYDHGQRATGELLARHGYETLSYSSHMPQLISKPILRQAFAELAELREELLAIDEWSLYFNFAQRHHGQLFHPPEALRTLCWPALPTDWQAPVRPAAFDFENFYPELYQPQRLFAGLPTAYQGRGQAAVNAEKIRRRGALERLYDSRRARLLRRGAWKLRQTLLRADEFLQPRPRIGRQLAAWTPRRLRRKIDEAKRHGDDPAWSLQLLTPTRLR